MPLDTEGAQHSRGGGRDPLDGCRCSPSLAQGINRQKWDASHLGSSTFQSELSLRLPASPGRAVVLGIGKGSMNHRLAARS